MLLRTYVQRWRMEGTLPADWPIDLSTGYRLVAWQPGLEHDHAVVQQQAYAQTLEARLFRNLRDVAGCLELMQAVTALPQFVPEATWLAVGPDGPCGCVQVTAQSPRRGWVQNLGVVPGHQGRGVGRALLRAAFNGLRATGRRVVHLEVSDRNNAAISLYREHGLVRTKKLYRELREELLEFCV